MCDTTEKEARSRCEENPNLESWLLNRGQEDLQEALASGLRYAEHGAAGERESYQGVAAENFGIQRGGERVHPDST